MSQTIAGNEHSLEILRDALRRAQVRLTPQRVEILQEVSSRQDHPDVEAIYSAVSRRMPGVSLDTVYRTLQLFVELGLIATLNPSRERARYDAKVRLHHHLVCRRCGATRDVAAEAVDQPQPPRVAADWGAVETVHVEFRGLCARCLAAEDDAQ